MHPPMFEFGALPAGIAIAVVAVTFVLVVLLVRGLRAIDVDAEPAWWPDFERALNEYMADEIGDGSPPA